MVFAKVWLLGILVAVLFVAATPPSPAPIIVNNKIPEQEKAAATPAVQPCPDLAGPLVAEAEGRLVERVERHRQELQAEIGDLTMTADTTKAQLARIEEQLRGLEAQNAQQKAEVQGLRSAMVAPQIMTWLLMALAAAGAAYAAFAALRARRSGA